MTPLILIVEDDTAIRESLRDLLIDEGYRVAEAAHGGEALAAVEREMPSLILLDLWMPVMTGGEFLARFNAPVPVVILTAGDEGPAGCPTLRKPMTLEQLLSAVKLALSAKAG